MRATARLMAMSLGAVLVLTNGVGASAQDPSPTEVPYPICSLLTASEVSDALGVEVAIANSCDVTCTYDAVDTSGELFSVSSDRDPKSLADRRLVFTGETIDVAGQEALYAPDTVPTLFVETPDGGTWTLLVLGTVPDGIDTKAAVTHLGELALSRFASLDAAATTEPVEPQVVAPSAMCLVLSPQEVTDALAVAVAITDGDDIECTYESAPAEGAYSGALLVSSRRSTNSLDDFESFFETQETEVAGRPALFSPGVYSRELYVSTPEDGMYTLQVVGTIGDGLDHQTVMTQLATLALSRLPGIAPLPTEEPARTFSSDPELEAKFPTQVGGVPLTVSSFALTDVGSGSEISPALQAALDAAGKTLADVRVGIGYLQDGSATSIAAVQVKGADAATLKSVLLPALFAGQTMGAETALQVAGKDVTSLALSGYVAYLYPKDDILWAVSAVEPALTEIFQYLP